MTRTNNAGRRRSSWGTALAFLVLGACGGVVGKPRVGGESHFLRHCGDGCGQGLQCVSDVCTRGCRIETDNCADLAANATCTNSSIEPGQLAVCDLGCTTDRACKPLGADFICDDGFCRGPAPAPGGEGGSGAMGGGTVGGAGAGGSTFNGGGSPTGGSSPVGGTTASDPIPAPRCLLPLAPTPCNSPATFYAFQDGQCSITACPGNANQFETLEECLSVCDGRPAVAPCPSDRSPREICLACGPAGGCDPAIVCAKACETREECGANLNCYNGVCQAGPCL